MTPLSRRDFLQVSSLAGLVPVLGGCAAGSGSTAAPPAAVDGVDEILGREHLRKGLLAMAAVSPSSSLDAHAGAAVIATWYFCRENALDERTLRAVRGRLDDFIESHPGSFPVDRPMRGAAASADRIAETLIASITELRANGHDAIFGAMAVQGLRDAPELAVEPVIDGVCSLLRGFTAQFPVEDPRYNREHPMAPYRDDQDVISRTFAAMARARVEFERGSRRSGAAPIHWMTHTDAILTLAECGYPEAARRGYDSLQQHINRPVTAADAPPEPRFRPEQIPWLTSQYWQSDEARNPQGFWSAGHVFKFPFSLFRLASRMQDAEQARQGVSASLWMIRDRRGYEGD